jgi:hypothetical protein
MANTVDRTPVANARAAFDAARTARQLAATSLADKTALVNALSRTLAANDPNLAQAISDQQTAITTLGTARNSELQARAALQTALTSWLPRDPTADAALLEAQTPIVLFPIRIETRFMTAQRELWVRVYPDEIFADSHEPDLTQEEIKAGDDYWRHGDNPTSWKALLTHYTPQRAAWIVFKRGPSIGITAATTDQPSKPGAWTQAVEARLLPDRWVVLGYRGPTAGVRHEVVRAFGSPILEPLALSIGPEALQSELVDHNGLKLDDAMVWTIDFTRALSVGMAIRVPLQDADLQQGFDRLLVFGIKASMSSSDTAQRIGDLFNAHHYTRGLAFVPQGTPTSNTIGKPSGYPPPDQDGSYSFGVERGKARDGAPDCAGDRLTRALALPSGVTGVTAKIDGADLTEYTSALAMSTVLYPATFGYYMNQMLTGLIQNPQSITDLRNHFTTYMAPRGPLSAIRIGGVPYGVLPVSSQPRWKFETNASPALLKMGNVLGHLRDQYEISAGFAPYVPHVGRTPNDFDKDILDILSMDASAREVRVRMAIGEESYSNMLFLFGLDPKGWDFFQKEIAINELGLFGLDLSVIPRVVDLDFCQFAFRYSAPLVDTVDLSEASPLAAVCTDSKGDTVNYIQWVEKSKIPDLQVGKGVPADVQTILLYRYLRVAALLQMNEWAVVLAEYVNRIP